MKIVMSDNEVKTNITEIINFYDAYKEILTDIYDLQWSSKLDIKASIKEVVSRKTRDIYKDYEKMYDFLIDLSAMQVEDIIRFTRFKHNKDRIISNCEEVKSRFEQLYADYSVISLSFIADDYADIANHYTDDILLKIKYRNVYNDIEEFYYSKDVNIATFISEEALKREQYLEQSFIFENFEWALFIAKNESTNDEDSLYHLLYLEYANFECVFENE